MYQIKTNVVISEEQISNLFVCAVEGGSDYWCAKIRPLNKDDKRSYDVYMIDGFIAWEEERSDDMYMIDGFIAWEEERSDDKGPKRIVTKDDVKEALQIMADKYPRHFTDVIHENEDAETGDVFLQLCCFKEIVYG